MSLLCTYVLMSLMFTKSQSWDLNMPKDIKHEASSPVDDDTLISELNLNIQYMPSGSRDSMWKLSPVRLFEATTYTAGYISFLGHKVAMKKETGQHYVLYDTIVFKDAFEAPITLLVVLAVVVVACLAITVVIEVRYLAVYNGVSLQGHLSGDFHGLSGRRAGL